MTTSEQLFEKFCCGNGIHFDRLSPDGSKTPDYEIDLNGRNMVVEIKELTPNEEEQQAIFNLEEKNTASWGSGKIGNRLRCKIDNAKRQIERLASEIEEKPLAG